MLREVFFFFIKLLHILQYKSGIRKNYSNLLSELGIYITTTQLSADHVRF